MAEDTAKVVLVHSCAVCQSTKALQRCSRCKLVFYCGKEHQTWHWSNGAHKANCVANETEHAHEVRRLPVRSHAAMPAPAPAPTVAAALAKASKITISLVKLLLAVEDELALFLARSGAPWICTGRAVCLVVPFVALARVCV